MGGVFRAGVSILWVVMMTLLPIISAEISERQTRFYEIIERCEIGTAISFKRDVDKMADVSKKHAADSSKSRLDRYRRLLVYPEKRRQREAVVEWMGRSLKYASGCSENSNDVAAIVECSNAVRYDPDGFAKDYPCDYQSWRNEVANKNLGRLVTGSVIQRLAQLHTDDQARMNSMSHTGSDGSNLQTRADRVSLPWGAVGENVAVGFTSAKAVVMAWMCSPPHRKNLMSCDFSKIGVGAGVSQQGRNYYTQVFSCDLKEKCGCKAGKAIPKAAPSQPRAVPKPPKVVKHTTTTKIETRRAPNRPPRRQPIATQPPPRQHHVHSSSSSSSYSQSGTQSSGSSRPGGSHCDWINSVWTCGSHIRPRRNNPYGRITGRT